MQPHYKITTTILSQVYKFAELHGRLYSLPQTSTWVRKLKKLAVQRSGFAAISIDKNFNLNVTSPQTLTKLVKHLTPQELNEYQYYTNIIERLSRNTPTAADLNIDYIEKVHADILNLSEEENSASGSIFRSRVRIIPKAIWENGIYKKINLEVKTKPDQIVHKLEQFVDWLSVNFENINPVLLAGISHFKIAEIHPFLDGNGRLSRVFERSVMLAKGVDTSQLIAVEDFYLRNRERYYDLIEEAIESGDLTDWLDFYSEGLLNSINETALILARVSGGTININKNVIEKLTDREEEIVELFVELSQASGAEIAKILKVSRQNVNLILKKLHKRGILTKIGQSTSSRYKLTFAD